MSRAGEVELAHLFRRREGLPFPLYEVNLLEASEQELEEISRSMSIGLSKDEMKRAQDHFRAKGRNPTDVEMEALGQAWSEHCCYKSSKPFLKSNIFGICEDKIVCREDAGVLPFDDETYYVIKIESHNHPSAIEPYGGAATGIGGVVRDVLCMGAQPIAFVDSLFFGPLDVEPGRLPKGVKHPRYLLQGVVTGIRDYGNRIGVPTVAGQVSFHSGYTTNCLVNVGCVGIMPRKHLTRSRAGGVGDVYIYVGGKTGRDGIHGVTFASAELHEGSEEGSRGAVQLGDPITKEPVIHATLEAVEKGLLTGMKDFGGGGLSCVSGELAHDAGLGAEVDLAAVPLKEEGMAPWEIWVSESQERMMWVVRPDDVEAALQVARKWDVFAAPVGRVIREGVVRAKMGGQTVLELDLEFSTGGPVYDRPTTPAENRDAPTPEFKEPRDYGKVVLALLSDLNVCSREWIIRQYDHMVRAATVLHPLQGAFGKWGPGDAAVLKPRPESWRGLAICSGVNPNYTRHNAYWGSVAAVDEVVRNLVAVGARPDCLADCLNFGNPEKPDRLGALSESTRGLGDAARALELPYGSGNVSLYNEGPTGPVPPTPTLLGVGIMEDVRNARTMDLKKDGNVLVLVGETKDELGGSVYLAWLEKKGGMTPKPVLDKTRAAMGFLVGPEAAAVVACHDLSEGGLGVALAEMAFAGDLGASVELSGVLDGRELRADVALFSESPTRWVCEVPPETAEAFVRAARGRGLSATRLGTVGGRDLVVKRHGSALATVPVDKLREAWRAPMARLLEGDGKRHGRKPGLKPRARAAGPTPGGVSLFDEVGS